MKIINIRNIKLNNDWSVDSIRIGRAYEGLIEGSPHHPMIKEMYNKVIREVTKNASSFGEQAFNQVPRFQPNELLKSIKIEVKVTKSLEQHANIITYMDETEELEDVLNEVIGDPEFVSGELVF